MDSRTRTTFLTTFLAIFFAVFTANAHANVVVNEITTSNTIFFDADGDSSDWIELYNNGSTPVDLAGWGLADDDGSIGHWVFPSYIIQPGEYLVVFASNKDRTDPPPPNFHTNFRLSDDDDAVILTDPFGQIVSRIDYDAIPRNLSFGKHTTGEHLLFREPTPGAANGAPMVSRPQFSQGGGFYDSNITVSLSTNTLGAEIFYTLDGTAPTTNSQKYNGPITVTKTTTIRAIASRGGYANSGPAGQTYFINFDAKGLPVLAITTEYDNLWDPGIGIFPGSGDTPDTSPNLQRKQRRPMHVEYFNAEGVQVFSQDAEIQVIGASSRNEWMRPFKISANEDVDPMHSHFVGEVLNKPITKYRHYQVRNNNQDSVKTTKPEPLFKPTLGIRNTLMAELCRTDEDFEMRFDGGAILVVINGFNFGMVNISEKRDNSTIEANHPEVDDDDVDMIVLRDNDFEDVFVRSDNTAVFGNFYDLGQAEYEEVSESAIEAGGRKGLDDFFALIDFMQANNLNNQSNYNYVKQRLHLKSFLSGMVAQIIAGNIDFATNNLAFWRDAPKGETPGPFHTYNYDFDSAFGLADSIMHIDSLSILNHNSKLLAPLLQNIEFKNAFIRKFDALLNGTFSSDNAIAFVRQTEQKIAPWVSYHLNLWAAGLLTEGDWRSNVNHLVSFLQDRPAEMRGYVESFFNLSGSSTITFRSFPEEGGTIQLDAEIFKAQLDGTGQYFNDVPLKIAAQNNRGFRFVNFTVDSTIVDNPVHTIFPNKNITVTANFEEDAAAPAAEIVINEIVNSGDKKMLDEDLEEQDWIELYNTTTQTIDLTDSYITDSEDNLTKWKFPSVSIGPGEFLILYASGKDKRDPSGNLHTSFKISSDEPVILVERNGIDIIDQITLSEVQTIASDNSGGRFPDGSTIFRSFDQATPGDFNKYVEPAKPAEIQTPADNSTLSGSEQVFTWSAENNAEEYQLNIGRKFSIFTTRVSADFIFSGGTTDLNILAAGLPQDGANVFARLWTKVNGEWIGGDVRTYQTQVVVQAEAEQTDISADNTSASEPEESSEMGTPIEEQMPEPTEQTEETAAENTQEDQTDQSQSSDDSASTDNNSDIVLGGVVNAQEDIVVTEIGSQYLEIENNTNAMIVLSDYAVLDQDSNYFIFEDIEIFQGTTINSGQKRRVFVDSASTVLTATDLTIILK